MKPDIVETGTQDVLSLKVCNPSSRALHTACNSFNYKKTWLDSILRLRGAFCSVGEMPLWCALLLVLGVTSVQKQWGEHTCAHAYFLFFDSPFLNVVPSAKKNMKSGQPTNKTLHPGYNSLPSDKRNHTTTGMYAYTATVVATLNISAHADARRRTQTQTQTQTLTRAHAIAFFKG